MIAGIVASGRLASSVGLRAGLLHWWSLDEPSGPRSDSQGGKSLSPSGPVGSVAARVGNGSIADPGAFLKSTSSTSLATGDFTVAGVFKASASNYGIVSRNGMEASTARQWLVTIEGGVLYFAVSTSGKGNAASVPTGAGLGDGQLHDFIAWRDTVANKIFVQLDGGAPASVDMLGTSKLYDSADPGFTVHGIGGVTYATGGVCDEIGIWKRALTPGERTWLRNGGAWRSYSSLAGYHP